MADYGFVVVHIPHASLEIPEEYGKSILLNETQLWREQRRMTDAFCDDLYDAPGFDTRVIAKYSRFVCDVERDRAKGEPVKLKTMDFRLVKSVFFGCQVG